MHVHKTVGTYLYQSVKARHHEILGVWMGLAARIADFDGHFVVEEGCRRWLSNAISQVEHHHTCLCCVYNPYRYVSYVTNDQTAYSPGSRIFVQVM